MTHNIIKTDNYLKDFVPYKQALELKKLGFDEPCFGCFSHLDNSEIWTSRIYINGLTENVTTPTFSQAFRWFREKYNIPSHIHTIWQHDWNNYSYQWHITENKEEWNSIEHYKTYEEAELACLRKLIEIVKQQL